MHKFNSVENFAPRTAKEVLALEITKALNDGDNLPLYIYFAGKYPEQVLREILSAVMEVPEEKIKKSRGALFNYLLKRYAQQANDNYRD